MRNTHLEGVMSVATGLKLITWIAYGSMPFWFGLALWALAKSCAM